MGYFCIVNHSKSNGKELKNSSSHIGSSFHCNSDSVRTGKEAGGKEGNNGRYGG